jgi:HD-GYP domain-containing protein (c-di-GMP phosphodiesterase class II)
MCDCLPTPLDPNEETPPRMPREYVNDIVTEFVAAMLNAKIYFLDHPRVDHSLLAVMSALSELGVDNVKLSVVGNFLVYRQRPLLSASLAASRLIQALDAWKSGGLELNRAATLPEVRTLLELLLETPQVGEEYEAANGHLEQVGCVNLRLLPPFSRGSGSEAGSADELVDGSDIHVPIQLYQSMVDVLQSVTLSVCQGGTIQFGPVQDHAEEVLRRLEAEEGSLLNLSRHEQYDAFTFGHSVRAAVLAMNYGRALTSNHDALVRLGTAALLHDVGKSRIPFEILHSRHRLTAEEREEINRHPELGARILIDHREADPLAVAAAFGHHKTLAQQAGYPDTAHEHQLSAITHIVKICDTYEALTAARPYKQPMSPIRAYRIMMAMKGHFHPRFLRRFIEVNGVYPNGQLVTLSDGRDARVIRQSPSLLQPVVRVESDLDGNRVYVADEIDMDLSVPAEGPELTVTEAVREDLEG